MLLFVNKSRRDTQHEDKWNELWTMWLVRSKQVTLLPNFVMIPKTKKVHCSTQVSIAILCHCFVKAQTVLVTLLCQGTSCLGHTVVKEKAVLVILSSRHKISWTTRTLGISQFAWSLTRQRPYGGPMFCSKSYSECRRDYMTKILR